MRRILSQAGMVCLVYICLSSCMKPTSNSGNVSNDPLLFPVGRQHDMGTVTQGHALSCKIPVKNISSESVRLRISKTSCQCTSAVLTENTILPGHQTILDVEINTSGAGYRSVDIDLEAESDLLEKHYQINVSRTVIHALEVIPNVIQLGDVFYGREIEFSGNIIYYTDMADSLADFHLLIEKQPGNWILDILREKTHEIHATNFKKVIFPFLIHGVTADTLKEGTLSNTACLRYQTKEKEQLINIPINAYVMAYLASTPPAAIFLNMSENGHSTTSVRIISNYPDISISSLVFKGSKTPSEFLNGGIRAKIECHDALWSVYAVISGVDIANFSCQMPLRAQLSNGRSMEIQIPVVVYSTQEKTNRTSLHSSIFKTKRF